MLGEVQSCCKVMRGYCKVTVLLKMRSSFVRKSRENKVEGVEILGLSGKFAFEKLVRILRNKMNLIQNKKDDRLQRRKKRNVACGVLL